MILQNWWYTTLLGAGEPAAPPLVGDHEVDCVIVGAGMAGISAALRLRHLGQRVMVLERNIFGGSSTGKSAGFLTPDSELELSQIIRRYGKKGATEIWDAPVRGVELIVKTATEHGFDCDLRPQDSLYLGKGRKGWSAVQEEAESRRSLELDANLYERCALLGVIGSDYYSGGIRYSNTYGIDAMLYAQHAKRVLIRHEVRVHESSEVLSIDDHVVRTHLGSVRAEHVVFCADKLERHLTHYADHTFHAQTFLAISEPLSDGEVSAMFPAGPFLCWDSDLVYSYFRLTGDQRLLLGGGSALTTFARHANRNEHVIHRVVSRFRNAFPQLKSLRFTQFWPGLIDTTRDLMPTVVRDPERPWLHFVLGCVGLPWAAFCGDLVARQVAGNAEPNDAAYYGYFAATRAFLMPTWLERVVGKPLVFSLNNAWAKYRQVDRQ